MNEKMKAVAVVDEQKMEVVAVVDEHKVEVREITRPQPKENQILMKVKACGLCTWEQRMFTREAKVALPFVGGHEVSGEIVALGDGIDEKEFPIGQKITARLKATCGRCYYCRRGEENLCTGTEIAAKKEIPGPGGLGQYISVDIAKVYKISKELPFDAATFAEPLACVLNSIERGKIELGDDVVVLGGGIMGMLHIMCAKLSGARVILSEPDEARREIAERLGCDITINPMETDPVEFVKSLTEGRGAEVVFNTTPISAVAKQAVEMTAPLGRCVMYSSQHPDKPFEISANKIHSTESVITGAVSPSIRSFNRSVNLLSKGMINPKELITGSYAFENAQEAFETAIRPDTYRIIVTF